MFAIYVINQLYDSTKSKKLIESIINSRKELQPIEKYFTFNLLESFSNNIPIFNSFNELNNHFELLISNHLKDTISSLFKEANSYTNQVTNHFLGFVDKVLNLNLNDPIKVSNYLLKNYDIYFLITSKEMKVFDFGKQAFSSHKNINNVFNINNISNNSSLPEKTTIIKNISSLRKQSILSTPETSSATSKNKI